MTQPPPYGPYHQPYPTPSVPTLRVPSDLAVGVIVTSVVLALLQVVRCVAVWPATDAYREAAEEGRPAWDVFTAYDVVGMAQFPMTIACYVVGCLWLQRIRTNVDALAPDLPHARSKIWVWLGWWVPIVSLWFPYQVVRDVQLSDRTGRPRPRVGWWWAGWLAYVIATQSADRLTIGDDTGSGVADALPVLEMIGTGGLFLALVCWITIVRRTTEDQRILLAPR